MPAAVVTLPSAFFFPTVIVKPAAALISLTLSNVGTDINCCKFFAAAPPEPVAVTTGGPLNLTVSPVDLLLSI